jgi:hypothetical protein
MAGGSGDKFMEPTGRWPGKDLGTTELYWLRGFSWITSFPPGKFREGERHRRGPVPTKSLFIATKPSHTVAARSRAWIVFARSNAGIVRSNPTRGMDIYVDSVFVLGSSLATDWPLIQGVLPNAIDCLRLRNWSETKRFTDAYASSGSNRNKPTNQTTICCYIAKLVKGS